MTRQEAEQAMNEKKAVRFFDGQGRILTGVITDVMNTGAMIITTKNIIRRVKLVDLWVA